jgi:hypothetical protein
MAGVVADEDDDGNAASALRATNQQPQRQNGGATYNRGEGGAPTRPAQTTKRINDVKAARAAAVATGAEEIAPLPVNLDTMTEAMLDKWVGYYQGFTQEAV